jgi:hypothetical protein
MPDPRLAQACELREQGVDELPAERGFLVPPGSIGFELVIEAFDCFDPFGELKAGKLTASKLRTARRR